MKISKPSKSCFLHIFTLVALAFNIQAQSFLTNGLLAYYPFDGNANDATGNGHDGLVKGALLTTNRFGQANSAYSFNGSSSVIVVSNSYDLQPLGDFSVSVWAEVPALPNNTFFAMFSKHLGNANDTGWTMFILPPNGVQPLTFQAAPYYDNNAPQANFPTGTWFQAVFTLERPSGACKMYINGNLVDSRVRNFSTNGDPDPFVFGAEYSAYDSGFNFYYPGVLDDTRIYNRVLSSNEVAALYAQESGSPQIITDLTNLAVVVGSDATLAVAATNSQPVAEPLSYQWYFTNSNPARVAGAYAQLAGEFVFNAVVTNGGYGYGLVPGISFVGGSGSGAAGYATISNGVVTGVIVTNAGHNYTSAPSVVVDPPNGFAYGETNSSLHLINVNGANVGGYYVVVSNNVGSVTSSLAVLSVVYPPAIVTDPSGFIEPYGSSNSLGVVVSGTSPLYYQWMLNGTNLLDANSDTYVISNLDLINLGDYAVRVVNAYGSVTSSIASVFMTPSLTVPFTGAISLWGQPTVLSVGAVGSGILSYQWYFNGLVIPGADGGDYELNSIQFTNAGLYSVVVSSTYGSVSNTAYQVVVNPADVGIQMFPGVMISGTPGYTYDIQSTSNLADPNSWVDETNLILSASFQIWSDYGASNQIQKYYRVLPGQ